MSLFKSLALAIACFTHLPAPRVDWDSENMRFMMMWFPFVGLIVGAFVALWLFVSDAVGFGNVLRAVGVTLVPLAVTGGFHLDGFMDVVDAQMSHAEPEKKRAILKDSHIGAFAAMTVAAYLLLYFGIATELPAGWRVMALLACLPVMSRCGSGFATTVFWGNGHAGTLTMFRDSADVRATVAVLVASFVVAAGVAIAIAPAVGLVMVAAEVLLLVWLNWFAQKNFGGMSGDVAGFFLQLCELVLLACVVLVAKVAGL